MTVKEINSNFVRTIGIWENALDEYSDVLFALKPGEESWSVGQVCQHLIGSTKRIFLVIDKCLIGDNNVQEQKTEAGEKAFATNILSEVKVKLPISIQATPPQPESRKTVKNEFWELKLNFEKIAGTIGESNAKGKEKHPVLGYLNAVEWLQTAEMHFRHHLKQKESIDSFLRQHAK
jgi:hypothetical protein